MRVAVVGAGIGARSHLFDLCCDSRYNVTAVCTAHPDTATAAADAFGIPRAYHDVGQMVADETFDAVVVCVPPRWTAEVLRLVTGLGLPVLVDKPGAERAPDLVALIPPAEQECRVAIGYNRRYQAATRTLREILQQGALGTLRSARCRWTANFTERFTSGGSFRQHVGFGDGVLLDTGSHLVDLLLFLGLLPPQPQIVTASATAAVTGPDVAFAFTTAAGPDFPAIDARAADGNEHWELLVHGSRGRARLDPDGLSFDPPSRNATKPHKSVRPIEDLYRLAEGQPPLGATLAEGAADLAVIEHIRKHLRTPWQPPRTKVLARRSGAC